VISVSALTKTFGTTRALERVTFRIEPGQVVGLLGRNGAGKTTTMRILTGFFPPTAGTVQVAGHDMLLEPSLAKARIGYLPEHPPVYDEMLVSSYLRFCARLRGVPESRIDEAVTLACERCGLGAVRSRIIGHLSRGYQQRVGLAQALVHDPDVLVLDEPTASLDPGQIHEVRDLLRHLSGEERAVRRTVLLSTHRLEDVVATCSRVLIISRGVLVADEELEGISGDLERRFLELTEGEESR
jgi:ABC-2 type transport system ATP-binding protein